MSTTDGRDVFAGWLQRELDKRGWTQTDLARLSGMKHGTISELLAAKTQIVKARLATVARLAVTLGVSIPELLAVVGVEEIEELDARVADAAYRLQRLPAGRRDALLAQIEAEAAQEAREARDGTDST